MSQVSLLGSRTEKLADAKEYKKWLEREVISRAGSDWLGNYVRSFVLVLGFVPGVILFPIQLVITTVLGRLVASLPFGQVLLFPIFALWWPFYGAILGTSYLWLKAPLLRPLVFLPGVVVVVVGERYVALLPFMGNWGARARAFAMCATWPASWLVGKVASEADIG